MNSTDTLNNAPRAASLAATRNESTPARSPRRADFIKWLRKVHGWVGLWGAALGLLFGTTGVLLNHRAGPLKLSTGAPQVSSLELRLPEPPPNSPRELKTWLEHELGLADTRARVQTEPARPVAWGERSLVQPEHWQLTFLSPRGATSAEYWVGNGFVSIKRTDNTLLATLANLHKGVGMSVGWILLVDTLAGSIVFLSLTGVLLWSQLNRRKTFGLALVATAVTAAICLGYF